MALVLNHYLNVMMVVVETVNFLIVKDKKHVAMKDG